MTSWLWHEWLNFSYFSFKWPSSILTHNAECLLQKSKQGSQEAQQKDYPQQQPCSPLSQRPTLKSRETNICTFHGRGLFFVFTSSIASYERPVDYTSLGQTVCTMLAICPVSLQKKSTQFLQNSFACRSAYFLQKVPSTIWPRFLPPSLPCPGPSGTSLKWNVWQMKQFRVPN